MLRTIDAHKFEIRVGLDGDAIIIEIIDRIIMLEQRSDTNDHRHIKRRIKAVQINGGRVMRHTNDVQINQGGGHMAMNVSNSIGKLRIAKPIGFRREVQIAACVNHNLAFQRLAENLRPANKC